MAEIRILVVDDFNQWRTTLRSILEGIDGCRFVGEAGDAFEAVKKASTLHPDIVLLDVGLPMMNGIEAAPKIRNASPHSRIIFVSQDLDNETIAAALATGAEGYLFKSRVVDELEPAMKTALNMSLLARSCDTFSDPHNAETANLSSGSPGNTF